MKLYINGDLQEVKNNSSIYDILTSLDIESKVMAVAVNSNIVKKDNWQSFKPNEDDKIEFLNFVGGG